MSYDDFIAQKMRTIPKSGFTPLGFNRHLFDFQKFIVDRALRSGRYAVFADCGLGKTLMQLDWARQIVDHTGGRVLILAPLAVTYQTIEEAAKFGIPQCSAQRRSGFCINRLGKIPQCRALGFPITC